MNINRIRIECFKTGSRFDNYRGIIDCDHTDSCRTGQSACRGIFIAAATGTTVGNTGDSDVPVTSSGIIKLVVLIAEIINQAFDLAFSCP